MRYPWSMLGIAPTDDEKAIRKAYALKLRETRPDENPTGFQALLEARDHALHERFYLDSDATDVDECEAEPAGVDVPPPQELSAVSTVSIAARSPSVAQREAGSVLLIDAPEPADDEEERTDVEDLLDEVGRQHPWRDLGSRWAAVFDALEHASFDDYFHSMHLVLGRLVEDLRSQSATTSDPARRQAGLAGASKQLGPYADVLADLEVRFQFLRQDRILFDYLDDDEAEELIEALTLAVGRTATQQPRFRPVVNVEDIDMAYVDAAFAGEPKMRDYYIAARKADRFPRVFAIPALLFSLPTALYFRLYGVAALLAVAMTLNSAFYVLRPPALYAPYAPISATVYIVVSIALALNWRRLRVTAMMQKVRDMRQKGLDPVDIKQRLADWGKPSKVWLCVGIAIMAFFFTVRIYVRYNQS